LKTSLIFSYIKENHLFEVVDFECSAKQFKGMYIKYMTENNTAERQKQRDQMMI